MLLGRDVELEELAGIIDLARSGGSAALVIRGEAGIGKTGLLNELTSLAGGFQVVRVDGVESEVQLGYAALHRIVLPFMDRIEHLPTPQRDALESAFGISASGPPDRFLLGLAALALLETSIERRPCLSLSTTHTGLTQTRLPHWNLSDAVWSATRWPLSAQCATRQWILHPFKDGKRFAWEAST